MDHKSIMSSSPPASSANIPRRERCEKQVAALISGDCTVMNSTRSGAPVIDTKVVGEIAAPQT